MDTKHEIEASHHDHEHFAPEYRDRLRTWLVKMIDSATIPGLCWENDDKTIFRMPWKHAGRQDYNLEEDSKIFMAWAKHSGRYREGIDKPEPIVWKTRLRCALNKMPDIKELPNKSRLDISEPYRVYQLLPPVHKASQIRRRFYHRTHSQEGNNLKGFEQSLNLADSSSSVNESSWTKKIAEQALPKVTSPYNLPANRTSPLLSGTPTVATPGFWLNSTVNMPLKSTLSTDLLHLHKNSSSALDTFGHLQTLAQTRYPLVNSMSSPFVPLTPTSLPSLYHTSANIEALKQYGLATPHYVSQFSAKAMEADQRYKGNLSTLPIEGANIRNRTPSPSDERKDQKLTTQSSVNFEKQSHNLNDAAKELYEPDSSLNSTQLYSLYFRLDESIRRINALESDLKKSQTAHAQEKEARKTLEAEKEEMKERLERMSQGLRELATHINPHEKVCYSASNEKVHQAFNSDNSNGFIYDAIRASSVSPVKTFKIADSSEDCSLKTQRRSTSMEASRTSPVVPTFKMADSTSRKRPGSPLDLTVRSPKKLAHCGVESDNCLEVESKPPMNDITGLCCATSSFRSLSSEDKRIRSPFLSESGSPDSVSRSRSLSPIPTKNNFFQHYHRHPGTIQVL